MKTVYRCTADRPSATRHEYNIRPARDPHNLSVLHLTADQWDAVDTLREHGVPVRGVGSHCAHIPLGLDEWVTPPVGHVTETVRQALLFARRRWPSDETGEQLYHFRPSEASGGVYLIFPETEGV